MKISNAIAIIIALGLQLSDAASHSPLGLRDSDTADDPGYYAYDYDDGEDYPDDSELEVSARLRGSASRNTSYLSAVSVGNNVQCRRLERRGDCLERSDCRWVIVIERGEQVHRCWPRIQGPCRPRRW